MVLLRRSKSSESGNWLECNNFPKERRGYMPYQKRELRIKGLGRWFSQERLKIRGTNIVTTGIEVNARGCKPGKGRYKGDSQGLAGQQVYLFGKFQTQWENLNPTQWKQLRTKSSVYSCSLVTPQTYTHMQVSSHAHVHA